MLTPLLLWCVACDKLPSTPSSGQVVAKVNSDEISIHQLNFDLSRTPMFPGMNVQQVGRQALDSLVDQQLVLQQARELKLDRDPEVLQAIEQARRQVLVQAYVDRITASVKDPEPADVAAYFKAHPELFGKRRVYQLYELTVDPKITATELQTKLTSSDDIQQIQEWLKSKKIDAEIIELNEPAEQLSYDVLAKVFNLQVGKLTIVEQPGSGALVVQLVSKREQPVTQDQTAPYIAEVLRNAKRKDLAAADLERLRRTAKIEYLGAYAQSAPNASTQKPPAPQAPSADSDYMDRGISGLK